MRMNEANSTKIFELIIENFPSRYEIYKLLEVFLKKNYLPEDYESEHQENKLILTFKDFTVTSQFAKFLQNKQKTCVIYSKLKIKMNSLNKSRSTPKLEFKRDNSFRPTISNKKSTCLTSLLKLKPGDFFHIKRITKVLETPRDYDLSIGEEYSPRLPRGKALYNSIPFIEKEKIMYIDYLNNKEKWLNKRGFQNLACDSPLSKSKNLSGLNSSSLNPIFKHKFRITNKNKWIGRKDFSIPRSNSMIQ